MIKGIAVVLTLIVLTVLAGAISGLFLLCGAPVTLALGVWIGAEIYAGIGLCVAMLKGDA